MRRPGQSSWSTHLAMPAYVAYRFPRTVCGLAAFSTMSVVTTSEALHRSVMACKTCLRIVKCKEARR
jgi:heme exporter protein D